MASLGKCVSLLLLFLQMVQKLSPNNHIPISSFCKTGITLNLIALSNKISKQ